MSNTYPRSLAGLYQISIEDRVLKPVRMIDTKPTDCALKEIRFKENETADAEFENGFRFTFEVKWDGTSNSYMFTYNDAPHSFDVKTLLGEVRKHVDIMSITGIDLSR